MSFHCGFCFQVKNEHLQQHLTQTGEENEKLSIEVCQLKCFSTRQSRWQKDFDDEKSLYLEEMRNKIENLERRNVELRTQIQHLSNDVRKGFN